ncbi:MAG: hypothetical protein HXY40_06885 [Chloroflexi bacterium]|nr:hypothetical protein [Chloroflexota bacterium]
MAITILIHVINQEPVKGEVDELPKPTDTSIICKNPRERNDKEFAWVDEGVTTVIFPWWRINYVQVLPSAEEEQEFPMLFRG